MILETSKNLATPLDAAAEIVPLDWLRSFNPRRGLSNGHLQTILGNYLPRPAFAIPSKAEIVVVDPSDGSRVLCHCSWQPESTRAARLTVVLVHGLEGSSSRNTFKESPPAPGAAGCNVVRMNMRNCGDTDELTPTLYTPVCRRRGRRGASLCDCVGLERVALVGYSMGGNLVLKLAGEWGIAPPLCAVATVCPAIDLAAGSDALHEPCNRLYEWHFLARLDAAISSQGRAVSADLRDTEVGSDSLPAAIRRQYCGALLRVSRCGRLLLPGGERARRRPDRGSHADLRAVDDPFVRLTAGDSRRALIANPNILLSRRSMAGIVRIFRRDRGDDIHWAEANVVRYLMQFQCRGQRPMEADWELEIGGDAPVIEADWPGFVDLGN